MEPFKPRSRTGPEAKLQAEIVDMLRTRLWHVNITHGNIYQSGLPDLYATHAKYGGRWIEVKLPKGSTLTPAQRENFPKMIANGTQIWFMVACNEFNYELLFKPCNFWHVFNSLL